ncbi:MAG: hypothetical protein K6U08_08935 [Firmicutes bacterium]|nr:hypothetical protein [Bacillota bacterium]
MTRRGRPGRRPGEPGGYLPGERGAVAALVALFLPCLLAAAALVLAVGALLVARAQLRAAADMAALAGVQDLDWDLLAQGVVYLREEEATADALAWLRANLDGRAFLEEGRAEAFVRVLNTVDPTGSPVPAACPVTGRTLDAPTVCVLVRAEVRLPLLPGPVTVSVHADASVVGRPP